MEVFAKISTSYLSTAIEIVAATVISIALIKFLIKYAKHLFRPNDGITNQSIRIHFGSSLTVALELLLAADILTTAIAPTWDEIGNSCHCCDSYGAELFPKKGTQFIKREVWK